MENHLAETGFRSKEAALKITIRIPPPLRKFTGGAESFETSAGNLPELIDNLEQKHPGIRKSLLSPEGNIHRFVNIYVNDEDIRFLGGMKYAFKEGDEILLIPSIAGGLPAGPVQHLPFRAGG